MKHEILKTFKGSQDGRITETFEAGTVADLSDYLVAAIEKDWARPVVDKVVEIDNKAIITDGKRRGRAK